MPMSRMLSFLCLVMFSLSVYSQQYIDVEYPTERICPGDEVVFVNNSLNPDDHSWLWAFCKANPNDPPTGDQEANWNELIKSPVYLSLNVFNNNYYVFINNYSAFGTGNDDPGKITRYTYDELGGPHDVYLDLTIPDMPKNLEGLQIIYDDLTEKWYGFITGGNPQVHSSYLARLDFGSDLDNLSPDLVYLMIDDTYEYLNFPHDLYIFYDEDNSLWHGFTVNKGTSTTSGSVTRFDFNNGIDKVPEVHNIGNFDDQLDKPVGIFPISEYDGTGNNWHVFITDSEKGLFRLDFGSDLLNSNPDCSYVETNSTQDIVHMRDLSLFRSCSEIYGYIVSGEGGNESNLVSLRFDDIKGVPTCTSYGTLNGTVGYGHSISEVFRVNNDYYAMICDFSSQRITRLILPSCESNPSVWYKAQPPKIVYEESGWKQIEIITDFGTTRQDNYCIDLLIDFLPVQPDTIYGESVVCPGDTVTYYVDPVNYTIDYHWEFDEGISGIDPVDISTIEVAISSTISPGPHAIEVYGENNCGIGLSFILEIQVDTATSIIEHPVNLLAIDEGETAQFEVLAEGTNLIYQWEESDDGGLTWMPLDNVPPYSGVFTNTLFIGNAQSDMTGNEYRCVVGGSCTPIEVISDEGILVVGSLLTTIGEAGAEACPYTDIDIPVKIAGFSQVTDLSLKLTYDTDLEYQGFDNVHDQLEGLDVINPNPGTLLITWDSPEAQTILMGKMVNLKFLTNVGDTCEFYFVETDCEYYSSNTKLDDDYLEHAFFIKPLPATPSTIEGDTERCEGTEAMYYDIPEPDYTDSYTWIIYPPEAGTINDSTNPVSVTWDEFFHGDAWIKVKGHNECGEGEFGDSLKIITKPLPLQAAVPEGDTNLCEAGPPTQYFTVGGDYATSYIWSINPPDAGDVSGNSNLCEVTWDTTWVGYAYITALSDNECGESRYDSDPIIVDVNPLPEVKPWVSESVIYQGESVKFSADVWRGAAPYSYHWDFMDNPEWFSTTADTTIVPQEAYREYELFVIDSNNCVMTSKIGVEIIIPMTLPNAFTPNGDGNNDFFKVTFKDIKGVRYRLIIFARNGQQVYVEEGSDLSMMTGWNGECRGERCPAGVYVYYLFYEIMGYDGREGEQLLKGSVTLIR